MPGGKALNKDQVLDIYERILDGEPGPSIALDYGISQQSVSAIGSGRNWGTVTGASFNPGPRTTLTEDNVREIDTLLQDGYSTKELAAMYGVSLHTIREIRSGRRWFNVTGRDSIRKY